jgi:hypothetical protein
VRVLVAAASTVTAVGLVFLVAWWFEMPLERAVYLAPIIVVSFGALAGIVVIWTRIALDPILRRRREQS